MSEDLEHTEDGPDPVDVAAGAREHYEDAPLYDYEYRRRRDDVHFYRRIAGDILGEPGRVLELACGSGRVTRELLRAGHTVVGLDRSAPMLSQARTRLARLGRDARSRAWLVRGDARRFAFGARFPLVVMAFNSFEHLYTPDDVAACLDCVRDHLEPDGCLVFDVQNPSLRWLTRSPDKRWARTRFTHPDTGRQLEYTTNHEYEPITQIALIRLYYRPLDDSGHERVVRLSQRKFFPAELAALLECHGFTVTASFGDFDGSPLLGDCPNQIVVCQARSRTAPATEFEIVARLGIVRAPGFLYYVAGGRVVRVALAAADDRTAGPPHSIDRTAGPPRSIDRLREVEVIAEPGLDLDDGYAYFLDPDGHIARVARS